MKEFSRLDSELQAQVLWLEGVYLELGRDAEEISIDLYALFDYYVEVCFDNSSSDPLYISAFNDMKNLEPYLEAIEIDELVDR